MFIPIKMISEETVYPNILPKNKIGGNCAMNRYIGGT